VTLTLERETLATRSARELGRVPETWVTQSETQFVTPDRTSGFSNSTQLETPIIGSAERFGYGRQHTDWTGGPCLICLSGNSGRHGGRAGLDGDMVALLDRALRMQVLSLRAALLQATARLRRVESVQQNVAPGSDLSALAQNRAVGAVTDLQEWLGLTVEEVARLTGVSRSAVLYWKRENAQPRPTAARNLFRIHALVRALRGAVPLERPMDALARVPDGSDISPYDLLSAGRYEDAERLLRPVIFHPDQQTVQPGRYLQWPEEEPASAGPVDPLDLRPPLRRARRVTVPQ
jgi:transcriptional regulator with XRE-family HTH domain